MTVTQRIPWLRIGAESIAIVGSILLAFSIDAWWDETKDRQHEAALMALVREELEDNQMSLQRFLNTGAMHLTQVDQFLRSTPEELHDTPHDSFESLIEAMFLPPTYDPSLSATNMLLESAPLSTQESLDLHQSVALWLRQFNDTQEEGLDLRAHASDVVDILARYSVNLPAPSSDITSDWESGDWSRQNVTNISAAIEQSGVETLVALRSDDAFVAAVSRKMHDQKRYVSEIARLSRIIDSILASLPQ